MSGWGWVQPATCHRFSLEINFFAVPSTTAACYELSWCYNSFLDLHTAAIFTARTKVVQCLKSVKLDFKLIILSVILSFIQYFVPVRARLINWHIGQYYIFAETVTMLLYIAVQEFLFVAIESVDFSQYLVHKSIWRNLKLFYLVLLLFGFSYNYTAK